MIDTGLVQLIQSDPTVKGICPNGGFMVSLPKDFTAYPSWTWRGTGKDNNFGLQFTRGLHMKRWQIEVYGGPVSQGSDCILLAAAIDKVINGYEGRLPDSDSTYVSSATQSDEMDFFDDAARTYRRLIEYEVFFAQD